jgi:NADP-dependent alcohol dehydrogenase
LALNGLIAMGVPQDWATHAIGHELTAIYGLDHAQTLAVVMPALWRRQKAQKAAKLLQYGERIWGITQGSEDERIEAAIAKTEAFFRSVGVKTRLADYGVADGLDEIPARFKERGQKLGERGDIGPKEVGEILELAKA